MGTVPTPTTFTVGQVVTAAQLNNNRDAINFLLAPPQAIAYRSAALSINTATWSAMPLDAEVFDVVQSGDTPMHDNTTNNGRIFARTAGKYEITGAISYASNATGVRGISININSGGAVGSGTVIGYNTIPAQSGLSTGVPSGSVNVYPMAVGDYIEMFAYQSSGGALAFNTGVGYTFLRMKWVGA